MLGGNYFYGTTYFGGANKQGLVFRMTPAGQLTTLYSFCAKAKCADGAQPNAPLTWTSNGDLIGTTSAAGPTGFGGEVFRLSGPTPTLTTFGVCTNYPSCTSGEFPGNFVVQASDGYFYTTTDFGGQFGGGEILKITSTGGFIDVHNFCQQTNCVDGEGPNAFLQGSDGNFYGTTSTGGTGVGCSTGLCGTVFKMLPSGVFSVLYNFCSQANCADGDAPNSLMQGSDGNLYGTTYTGGINDSGTIFQISTDGQFRTLYQFCASGTCTDGIGPTAISQSTDGKFYGTTGYGGGPSGGGTVFTLDNGLAPFVQTVSQSSRVGSTIEILGQGLTGTTAVAFNGTTASFKVVSDTYLSATVPTGATSGFVAVTTPTGTLTSNLVFHVTN